MKAELEPSQTETDQAPLVDRLDYGDGQIDNSERLNERGLCLDAVNEWSGRYNILMLIAAGKADPADPKVIKELQRPIRTYEQFLTDSEGKFTDPDRNNPEKAARHQGFAKETLARSEPSAVKQFNTLAAQYNAAAEEEPLDIKKLRWITEEAMELFPKQAEDSKDARQVIREEREAERANRQ